MTDTIQSEYFFQKIAEFIHLIPTNNGFTIVDLSSEKKFQRILADKRYNCIPIPKKQALTLLDPLADEELGVESLFREWNSDNFAFIDCFLSPSLSDTTLAASFGNRMKMGLRGKRWISVHRKLETCFPLKKNRLTRSTQMKSSDSLALEYFAKTVDVANIKEHCMSLDDASEYFYIPHCSQKKKHLLYEVAIF